MPTDIVTTSEIGTFIRERRKELGLSQEQLAEIVGVSYQQIQRYENGSSMLNVENVQRIAKALGVPVTTFFDAGRAGIIAESPQLFASDEEKKILKSFRELTAKPDRLMVLGIVRRLIKK